jgi:leucine dehydrogenase
MNGHLEEIKVPDYERVVYYERPDVDLRAFISIHNTHLGPSCGGIRLLPYASKDEALTDVLRLSRGMSYKSALAGIGFGGGKSVILSDPKKKTPEMLRAFGEFVNHLDGKYVAAKDMNVTSQDLLEVKKSTKYVLGIDGEPGSSGDPSPVTSRGAYHAFRATIEEMGLKNMKGLKVAVQGLGHVGYTLAELLHEAGAELWVTDINPSPVKMAVEKFKAHAVSGEAIYDVDCDIFSPNARGAVINPETITRLKCKAVVGAANNQLLSPQDGLRLHEKGILYAPDFAVNAGGIINIFIETVGYDPAKAFQKTDNIYQVMREIYQRARKEGKPPFLIADKLAEERIYGSKK